MKYTLLFILVLSLSGPLDAIPLSKRMQQAKTREALSLPPQEHFRIGIQQMGEGKWELAARHFEAIGASYPFSPYAKESYYHLGIAQFNLGEYDLSNMAFTNYLKEVQAPKNFEEAMSYKFEIAENLKCGARCHLFGQQKLPKWKSGKSLALEIYDELIATLPNHDLACKSLFAKGEVHWELKEYKEAIESFQKLIKRFGKDPLAPESYLMISRIYIDQAKVEMQNSDILAFAERNARYFEEDFPRDENLAEAKQNFLEVKEIYARGLWETGKFYERVGKPKASMIYYKKAVVEFPETEMARVCEERIDYLCKGNPKLKPEPDATENSSS